MSPSGQSCCFSPTWSRYSTLNSNTTLFIGLESHHDFKLHSVQFDKVQESFLSVEQQTSTFQAHLEGLGKENQEGHAGPFALARANSRSESPQTFSGRSSDVEHRNSDEDVDGPRSLYERSALQFSSTIGRLRKSGRKK